MRRRATRIARKLAFGTGECIICLQSEPPPAQRGCVCRGEGGLAHVECLASHAKNEARKGRLSSWFTCHICKHELTGPVRKHLAIAWMRDARSRAHRLLAEHNLSICSRQSLDWTAAATQQTHVIAALDHLVDPDRADSMLITGAEVAAVASAGFADMDEFYGLRVKATQELAISLASSGQIGEAIRRLQALLEWCRRVFGTSAETTLGVASDLATTLLNDGRVSDSIGLLELVVEGLTATNGARGESTLSAKANLASALAGLKTQDASRRAVRMLRETLQLADLTFGKQHPFTMTTLANLASTLFDLGEYVECEKLYRESCVRGRGTDPHVSLSVYGLARALEAQGRSAESRALALREAAAQETIAPNTRVVLTGLRTQPELNRSVGTVIAQAPSGRYTVLVGGRHVSAKRECIRRARCYNPTCTSEPAMSVCGRCESAFYCSPACQRAHWSVHKSACVRI